MPGTVNERIERTEYRVDNLEALLGQFIVSTGSALTRLEREMVEFKDEMKSFKNEMLEFKNEMLEFKDEMKDFKNEMLEFKDGMKDFKNEMLEFKDEMKDFKTEMSEYKDWSKANIINMNTQWGNLARKMGSLVEDIFYPSSDIVIEKYFKCRPSVSVRNKRVRRNGEEFEVDILALCKEEGLAFMFEIKANPDDEDNKKKFLEKIIKAPDFLEEINNLKIIPVYGGLSFSDSTLSFLSKRGVYGIVFKGDVLEIPNFEDVSAFTA